MTGVKCQGKICILKAKETIFEGWPTDFA